MVAKPLSETAADELVAILKAENQARQQAEERAQKPEGRAERLAQRLREMGVDPNEV
ncbi:MAG: hypothetical protein AAF921_09260 [Cyanobacteria bacterium P01_D01_bin.44]